MSKPSTKGDRLENRVSEILSVWLCTHLKEGYRPHFRNEPSSGAKATTASYKRPIPGHGKVTPASIGVADVHPLTPEGHELLNVVSFECKNYKDIPWGRLLFTPDTATSTNMVKYQWDYHNSICARYGTIPMMVYNETSIRSGQPVLILPLQASRALIKECPAVGSLAYIATFASLHADVLNLISLIHQCPYPLFIRVMQEYQKGMTR